jgi:hypothetical protein
MGSRLILVRTVCGILLAAAVLYSILSARGTTIHELLSTLPH